MKTPRIPLGISFADVSDGRRLLSLGQWSRLAKSVSPSQLRKVSLPTLPTLYFITCMQSCLIADKLFLRELLVLDYISVCRRGGKIIPGRSATHLSLCIPNVII